MFITYGWYANNWWIGPGASSQYNCTDEERATVVPYTLAVIVPEFLTDGNPHEEAGNVSLLQYLYILQSLVYYLCIIVEMYKSKLQGIIVRAHV